MQLLRLNTVLAAVDDDDASVMILRGAHELATAANARLHIAHVASSVPSDATAHRHSGEHERTIQSILERAGLDGNEASLHLPTGDPAHVIRSLADLLRADVIVLGHHRSHKRGRPEIGSTALRVVTNSWAPCLLLSRPIRLPLERVLAPIDLSDASRGALVIALSWASALRGAGATVGAAPVDVVSLTALYVDSSGMGEGAAQNQSLDDAVTRLRADAGKWASVAISGETRSGSEVPRTIAEYAAEHHCDLVVLGTRGVGLDDVGRLGSVSLEVGRRIDIPMLLVPPAMWSTHTGG